MEISISSFVASALAKGAVLKTLELKDCATFAGGRSR